VAAMAKALIADGTHRDRVLVSTDRVWEIAIKRRLGKLSIRNY
jgi:PIN domain nuclease of toxin-antitoxin system